MMPSGLKYFRLRKWRKRLGRRGENCAARMLSDAGYVILARNCRTPRAEIDIVARDGLCLVFVEVKTLYCRHGVSTDSLHPASHLGDAQKRRLYRAAFSYLRDLGNPPLLFRFDLVEVIYGAFGPSAVRHWRNHFGGGGRKWAFGRMHGGAGLLKPDKGEEKRIFPSSFPSLF